MYLLMKEEKEKTEDGMIIWHHWLNRHEFEQAPGDGEGQGNLVCCSLWSCKESDKTEQLNNNKKTYMILKVKVKLLFTQSFLTLLDPMDCILPYQAPLSMEFPGKNTEWVFISLALKMFTTLLHFIPVDTVLNCYLFLLYVDLFL